MTTKPSTEIVSKETNPSETLPSDQTPLSVGQWYWVKGEKKKDRWFGCIIHVGSNYVEMSNIYEGTQRIHLDDFDKECEPVPDPEKVIQDNIQKHQTEVQQLMGRVSELTARLGVGPSPELNSGQETQALARVTEGQDYKTYRASLVKAKKELLPELFRKIEKEHQELASWMKAMAVPWEAQVEQMKGVIDHIDARIFNVKLYAGLSEDVEQIADGEPAELGEKIRVLQRRCYMDEECLARYEVGGMEFKDIRAFDRWLTRPSNLDRLLPFPRCIVAFKVRRNMKRRESFGSFIDLFSLIEKIKLDEYTFLFIRNGEKVFRMGCDLEFGEKLFPDMNHQELTGPLYANVSSGGDVSKIITENQLLGLREEYAKAKAEHEEKRKKHEAEVKAWEEAKEAAEKDGKEFDESRPWFSDWIGTRNPDEIYEPFETNNIYYDDIRNKVASDIQNHNRIGLIIQGLLDRSPILHPHPPWRIWTMEGFRSALELVYDESRALVGGELPNFEAYWAKVNESLKTGSVTIGQEILWEEAEAEKYNAKHHHDRYQPDRYKPYGNPGPGTLAKVSSYEPRTKRCVYAWHRDGISGENLNKQIRSTFTCDADTVFNVDAYKPGDFHIFFDDPRTRGDYLKWAPLLLEAEEYHAGNRKVEEPVPPKPKKESSWEGQKAYERKKRNKLYLGKAVISTEDIETKGGKLYESGTIWRVTGVDNGFTLVQINADGSRKEDAGWVRGVEHYKLDIVWEIPGEPE